jgi:phenylacetic acid degradation operon negative regulatory protein
VHARSALFDLYGDHLLDRGAWAPISATVSLMGSLGVSAPAVRTAVSRMVREGWLAPQEKDSRGYAATTAGEHRLRSAHARIYRTDVGPWDGQWHVIALPRLPDRSARDRLARSLGYLGYGRLAPDTWVAPRESMELDDALASALGGSPRPKLRPASFHARYEGAAWQLAQRVWDTGALAAAYRSFAAAASADGLPTEPEQAFVTRTLLVHEWRKFLFTDPGLPDEVLPADWPGRNAAAIFDDRQARLKPLARAWVDEVLARAQPHGG